MNISLISDETKPYRHMFSTESLPMRVVYLDIEGVRLGLSMHQGDDYWCADSYILANGMPYFVHGEGDRSCDKQIAGGEILEFLNSL